MTHLLCPLVGSHFRPPAKLVIASLPSGAPLRLEPEPENQYDSKAIRVLVSPQAIPASQYDKLEAELPGCGHSLDSVLEAKEIFLGYICASTNVKELGKWASLGVVGNAEVHQALDPVENPDDPDDVACEPGLWQLAHASLQFGPAGNPLVSIQVPAPVTSS